MALEESRKNLECFYKNANGDINVTYGMAFSTTVVLGNEKILGVKSCVMEEKNGSLTLFLDNEMILDKMKKIKFSSNEIKFKYKKESKRLCFEYKDIFVEVSEGEA